MRSVLAFGVLLVVAVACGGGKDGNFPVFASPEEEQFEKNIEEAMCSTALTCCRQGGWEQPAPACKVEQLILNVGDPHVPGRSADDRPFDAREAEKCLKGVRARAPGCRLYSYLPECRQVWHREQALGAPCVVSADCAPSSKGAVRCQKTCVIDTQTNEDASTYSYYAFYKKPYFCAPGYQAR